MRFFLKVLPIALSALFFCGCSDISTRGPDILLDGSADGIQAQAPEESTAADSDDAEAQTSDSDAAVQQGQITVNLPQQYKGYYFTNGDKRFLSDCVFFGDSVCKGLSSYDFIPAVRCFAKAGVAARNITDFTFELNGEEISFEEALAQTGAKHVVFSMGMNDLNMTDEAQYAENYLALLDKAAEIRPDVDFYVMAISPVTVDSQFAYNSRINKFNQTLGDAVADRENCRFVDAGTELKNDNGALHEAFCADDQGVHLTAAAYYGILWTLCQAAA